MGQNPTSGVLSLQRRRDIYALCCKYDVLIVEDDPYWYLQYPTATAVNTTTASHPDNQSFNPDVAMFANAEPRPSDWKSSGYDFLDSLVPSSVSIDTEGRVIRLDTFSKTVAPGCRLGWITAQPKVIEALLRVTETSTQQPSGFVQSMIAELMLGPDQDGLTTHLKSGKGGLPSGAGWKADGWVRWLEGLRGNYERRMQKMARIMDNGKYLVKTGRRASLDIDDWSVVEKTQILSFDYPVGGMFLWLRIHFHNHPLYTTYKKASELPRLSHALWIFWTTEPYLALVGPGNMFCTSDKLLAEEGWQFFRLCFAAINEEDLGPVSQRVVDGINAFFRIKEKKVVEDLLETEEATVESLTGKAELSQMFGPC